MMIVERNRFSTNASSGQTLLTLLDTLYESALSDTIEEFPLAIIRLLKATFGMDGAILAFKTGTSGSTRTVNISAQWSEHASPDSFIAAPPLNSLTEAYIADLVLPVQFSCGVDFKSGPLGSLAGFVEREGILHLLAGSKADDRHSSLSWVILYRRTPQPFVGEDSPRLKQLWPHLSRAIEINRRSTLDNLDGRRNNRSSALLDESGTIMAADPVFVALIREEWPATGGNAIPRKVYAQLAAGKAYLGRAIQIESVTANNQLVFHAKRNSGLVKLTPAEQQVANRFAVGKSSKQIANELGVSPNTVRSQLSNLYSKLNVHDKAQLAQRLMAV